MTSIYCPIPSNRQLSGPSYRYTDHGLERYCPSCGEWWPADTDFWFTVHGKLRAPCRACYFERYGDRSRTKTQKEAA